MDARTHDDSTYHASIASCGKNYQNWFTLVEIIARQSHVSFLDTLYILQMPK